MPQRTKPYDTFLYTMTKRACDAAWLPAAAHIADHFWATVVWIKISLGTEVGLGSGHIVLDGNPASPPKKNASQQPPPLFGPCLL